MGAGVAGASLLGSALDETGKASAAAPAGTVGMNLGPPRGRQLAFVDAAITLQDYRQVGESELTFDDRGYPSSDAQVVFFDNRPVPEWFGEIDDPAEYEIDIAGTYTLSFTGAAQLTPLEGNLTIENEQYESATNTTTADVTLPEGEQVFNIEFSETKRTQNSETGSGITDISLIRPGYDPETDQTFTQPVCDLDAPFDVLRFMGGWLKTTQKHPTDENGEPLMTDWADRIEPTDGSFFAGGELDKGVPWEYVVEYANTVGVDIWINVPVSATDDYVRQLAQLLNRQLGAEHTIYVEYANEVWNPGVSIYYWNKRKAKASVESGSNLDYDGASDPNTWQIRRVAKRSAEISNIFSDVFGTDAINDRVRVMVPFSAAGGSRSDDRDKLQYVADNYSDPSELFWGYCVTGYIGYDPIREGDSVTEILDKMESNLPSYGGYAELAAEWGLELAVYEGGPNTSKGGKAGTTNVENRIEAARTERIADLIQQNVTSFFDAGGSLYMAFTDVGGYSRYGTWGATDDVTKPFRNHKYQQYLELNGSEYVESESHSTLATVSVESSSVQARETETVPVTLSSAPDGVSGFELSVTVADTAVCSLSGASIPAPLNNDTATVTVSESSAHCKVADLDSAIGENASDVTLATLEVDGVAEGATSISVTVEQLDDDAGDALNPSLDAGSLAVTPWPPALDSELEAPTDPDGDGLYEDVNGNNRMDYDDIVELYEHMDDEPAKSNVEAFDFNGSGELDYDDIVKLFEEFE